MRILKTRQKKVPFTFNVLYESGGASEDSLEEGVSETTHCGVPKFIHYDGDTVSMPFRKDAAEEKKKRGSVPDGLGELDP